MVKAILDIKSKTSKKILCLSIFILVFAVISVNASGENIDISLIEYNSETLHARIQVRNLDSKSLRNVTLIVDNHAPYFLVGALSPGNAIVHSQDINSGMHNLTVTANGGVSYTRGILFTKSREQYIKDIINNITTHEVTTTILPTTTISPTSTVLPTTTTLPTTTLQVTPNDNSTLAEPNMSIDKPQWNVKTSLLIFGLVGGVVLIILSISAIYRHKSL